MQIFWELPFLLFYHHPTFFNPHILWLFTFTLRQYLFNSSNVLSLEVNAFNKSFFSCFSISISIVVESNFSIAAMSLNNKDFYDFNEKDKQGLLYLIFWHLNKSTSECRLWIKCRFESECCRSMWFEWFRIGIQGIVVWRDCHLEDRNLLML